MQWLYGENKVSHDCTFKQAVSCFLLHQKRRNFINKVMNFLVKQWLPGSTRLPHAAGLYLFRRGLEDGSFLGYQTKTKQNETKQKNKNSYTCSISMYRFNDTPPPYLLTADSMKFIIKIASSSSILPVSYYSITYFYSHSKLSVIIQKMFKNSPISSVDLVFTVYFWLHDMCYIV